jgi:hypothetical protein
LVAPTILFIASDAVGIRSQIMVINEDSCPEFDRWLELKRLGTAIDFRGIQRMGFEIGCLGDYIVDISVFETRSLICGCDEVGNQIYDRIEDGCLVLMK